MYTYRANITPSQFDQIVDVVRRQINLFQSVDSIKFSSDCKTVVVDLYDNHRCRIALETVKAIANPKQAEESGAGVLDYYSFFVRDEKLSPDDPEKVLGHIYIFNRLNQKGAL